MTPNKQPRKFTMQLPAGFAEAVGRRHNGRELEEGYRQDIVVQMQLLYRKYKLWHKKREDLDKWWDDKKIESYFMQAKWYYAHRKLRKIRENVRFYHQQMFYLLLNADGNYEPFDPFYCISAEEVYEDFMGKYNKVTT